MSELFIYGLCAHLVADWFLQNEPMALNKVQLGHPWGIIHALLHVNCLLLFWRTVGEPATLRLAVVALTYGLAHYVIDLRTPLVWWRKLIGQTTEGDMAVHVAIWQDQAAHVLCVLAASVVMS
jgi:uncharacterized protein DUF3307